MRRALPITAIVISMLTGSTMAPTAAFAGPRIHLWTSNHPLVSQAGRQVAVTIRVGSTQTLPRVSVTDTLPLVVSSATPRRSSASADPRPSPPRSLRWTIHDLRPGHPVFLRWIGPVGERRLMGHNVVKAWSGGTRAGTRARMFFAGSSLPRTGPSRSQSRNRAIRMHREKSSSPFYVRWDVDDGAKLATSSVVYDRQRKARVTESFDPDGPRAKVRLRIDNLRRTHPLAVDGKLVQRTLTAGGRRVAWLTSPRIHTVLEPGESVAASFAYRLPTGNYVVTGGFRPA